MIRKVPSICSSSKRTDSGETLVSLLVATLIMAFVAAAIMGLASLNTVEGNKIWNRVDSISAAREALDRVSRAVRMARSVGDMYGAVPEGSVPTVGTLPAGPSTATSAVVSDPAFVSQYLETGQSSVASESFPSVGDPCWGPYATVPATPPSGRTLADMANNPYVLSSECLILQVPTFDGNGYPNKVPNGGTRVLQAVDTYVYEIVPDLNNPGPPQQYKMQVTAFPAPGFVAGSSPQRQITNVPTLLQNMQPVTIASGIIGPRDPGTGRLGVFQYCDRSNNTITCVPVPANIPEYNGIVVNLEILKQENNQRASVMSLRSQTFMRNNTNATVIGPPPAS